jgi:hypothetical protein
VECICVENCIILCCLENSVYVKCGRGPFYRESLTAAVIAAEPGPYDSLSYDDCHMMNHLCLESNDVGISGLMTL